MAPSGEQYKAGDLVARAVFLTQEGARGPLAILEVAFGRKGYCETLSKRRILK